MDPKVGMCCHPPLSGPHCKTNGTGRYREGDPIHPGVRFVRWCRPLWGTLLSVLSLFMGCQQPFCQLHLVLWNTKLSPAANPIRMDPCQSSAMYTLPLSVRQQCIRAEKPPQLIYLYFSEGPIYLKTSIHPTPFGS